MTELDPLTDALEKMLRARARLIRLYGQALVDAIEEPMRDKLKETADTEA